MLLKFLAICFGMLMNVHSFADGNSIPFSSKSLSSLTGRDICNLEGEFSSEFGVLLDGRKEYSVEYRMRDDVVAVFLLSHPTGNCGKVEAVLDVTELIKKDEFVEFQCYTKNEGGTGIKKWGHIIGLVSNDEGKKRIVRARLAWRVNLETKRFDKISTKTECDTIGYADGE